MQVLLKEPDLKFSTFWNLLESLASNDLNVYVFLVTGFECYSWKAFRSEDANKTRDWL